MVYFLRRVKSVVFYYQLVAAFSAYFIWPQINEFVRVLSLTKTLFIARSQFVRIQTRTWATIYCHKRKKEEIIVSYILFDTPGDR